jgi:ubiquinone/menaquinone biosynthesis C-methylase UbiE
VAGTVDALLCCKDGVSNVTRMFSEASRVLTPGGTFLLISLGDPARRLCLLCCEKFDWTVQVVLLPKITPNNQASVDGR